MNGINYLILSIPVGDVQVKTSADVLEFWNMNRDLRNQTVGVRGTYANKADVEQYYPGCLVEIRYNQNVDLVILKNVNGTWEVQ